MLLGDSRFPLSSHLLIPYRGVRYDLNEYFAGTKAPRNAKELYNRPHTGARSVIDVLCVQVEQEEVMGAVAAPVVRL
ncbi:hypothetical protein OC842_006187, partial [Tilletia horrida]